MLANASPRKPMVLMRNRSSMLLILEVACRSKAMRASVSLMPLPLSVTCTSALPASFTNSLISSAPASTAFSSSSFTALAGRCITSPAAIWLAMLSGNSWMMSGKTGFNFSLRIYGIKGTGSWMPVSQQCLRHGTLRSLIPGKVSGTGRCVHPFPAMSPPRDVAFRVIKHLKCPVSIPGGYT